MLAQALERIARQNAWKDMSSVFAVSSPYAPQMKPNAPAPAMASMADIVAAQQKRRPANKFKMG
jgi:hypothetical protein